PAAAATPLDQRRDALTAGAVTHPIHFGGPQDVPRQARVPNDLFGPDLRLAVGTPSGGDGAGAHQCESPDAGPQGFGDQIPRAAGIDLVVAGAPLRVCDGRQMEDLLAVRTDPGQALRPRHIGADGPPAWRQGGRSAAVKDSPGN